MCWCGNLLWCNQCKELLPEWITGGCWIEATKVSDNNRLIKNTRPAVELINWWGVNIVSNILTDPDGCRRRVYALSVSCCDEKVRVCANEWDPKFLREAIEVTYPLLKDVDCEDWVIRITLDQNGIVHPSYKDCDDNTIPNNAVLMTPTSMNSIYNLGDCYWWFDWASVDSNEIPANELTPCKRRWLKRRCSDPCSCCTKGIAEVVLTNNVLINQPAVRSWWGSGSWFYIITAWSWSANFLWQPVDVINSSWSSIHQYWPLWTSANWVICNWCNIGRLVTVEAWGSIEGSRWVNGLRVQIYEVNTTWTNTIFEPIAEWRDSPTSDPDVTTTWWVAWTDWIPDNYKVTSDITNTWTKLNRWYRFQERQNFYLKRDVWMRPWSCYVLVVKVSSVIDDPDYDISKPAQVAILGKLASDGSVSWDLWAYLNVKTIDDCCIIQNKAEDCDCGLTPPANPDGTKPRPTPLELPSCPNGFLDANTGQCLPAVLPWTWAWP